MLTVLRVLRIIIKLKKCGSCIRGVFTPQNYDLAAYLFGGQNFVDWQKDKVRTLAKWPIHSQLIPFIVE